MNRLMCFNFTIAALEKLPRPQKGYKIYKDVKNPYLYLYITPKGIISFFVRKRILGRDERVLIGRFPVFSIEQARKTALIYLAMIASGKHPLEEKKKRLEQRLPFGKHFQEYLERYSKVHKKTWRDDKRDIEKYCKHWFQRDLSEIKKSEVQRLVEKVCASSGLSQANKILIRIRAIYNKAIEWDWVGENPTKGIKRYKERSRDRFAQPAEMPFLIRALMEIKEEVLRDYFCMLFLTGARKTNVRMMRREEIFWDQNEWRIPVTKNGDTVIVPLVPRAIDILQKRCAASKSEWIFSQEKDIEKFINDPKDKWKETLALATLLKWREHPDTSTWINDIENKLKADISKIVRMRMIIEKAKQENIFLPASLMDIHLHDIRRTFASYQAMNGASLLTIGKSLGHRSTESTKVYARLNTDVVRSSVEKATSAIFGNA